MRICKPYEFGPGIKGFRLGWSLAGPPLMTVFFYCFDDLLVDSGQAHMGKEAAAIAREHKVTRIYLTHHHEDHSGNAALICSETNAQIFGHEQTRAKMQKGYRILPYQKYVWGRTTPVEVTIHPERIETVLGPLVPVHTPGHSRDHTAYFLPEHGVLFSGDLYLGDRIKYFRVDEDLGTEIESLKKILTLDFDILLCNHNPRKEKGLEHIRSKLSFMEDLYGKITSMYAEGLREKEIFSRLRLKEDYFTKAFCFGNVSMMNGIKSCIRHYEAALY